MMTVGKLKRVLNRVLENLEDFDDDKEICMVSNTYFLGHPHYFLGIAGYDGGYINLDEIPVEEEEEDEEEW